MAEFSSPGWHVDGDVLVLKTAVPHPQVLPFYPQHKLAEPTDLVINQYSNGQNSVGHAQRVFVVEWALRGLTESGLVPGIDLGGGGVPTPGCISVDYVGTGDTSAYGGTYNGVHVKADASRLLDLGFGRNTYSCVISNHLCEHFECAHARVDSAMYRTNEARMELQRAKKQLGCNGHEIVPILQSWIEIVRPGGYIASIIPDEETAEAAGTSSLFHDPTHNHAFDSRTFQYILQKLTGVRIIQYNTLRNQFSFDFVLQKL